MTNHIHAAGGLIDRRREMLCCLCLVLTSFSFLPGCSFDADDVSLTTERPTTAPPLNSPLEQSVVETSIDKPAIANSPNNSDGELTDRPATDKSVDFQQSDTSEKPVRAAQISTGSKQKTSASPAADRQKIYELTFDDLAFEMEKTEKFKRTMLTPKINSYDGSTIRLRGFIRPSFSQSGLTKFVFVRDNKECCFGPGAALYDCVLVRLAKGNKTDFTVRPVTIEGTFYLKEYQGPDGKVWSIYRMKDAAVR